jgi:hypothetical protein
MWVASKLGFFSIVRKGEVFHVRGRARGDLDKLKAASGVAEEVVESWAGSDYAWRMIVSASSLGEVMAALEGSVDYGNFKGMIGAQPDQADKLDAYHEIWRVMDRWGREAGARGRGKPL